jgi:hypothetical protein
MISFTEFQKKTPKPNSKAKTKNGRQTPASQADDQSNQSKQTGSADAGADSDPMIMGVIEAMRPFGKR